MLAVLVFMTGTAVQAEAPVGAPTTNQAQQRSGNQLIKSLKNRSPQQRWSVIRQQQIRQQQIRQQQIRQQQRRKPFVVNSPRNVRTSVGSPQTAAKLSRSLSQWEPSTQNVVVKPQPARAFPKTVSIKQPLVPVGISHFQQALPVKNRPVIKRPEQLPKVTDIQPFHDYSPPNLSKMVKSKKYPKESWTKKEYQPREFEESLFTWNASNVHHNPLYFEDPALERYGHTYHELVQPLASIGRFGLQLIGLPYQMTLDPICKKEYPLGWYRPGECAPKLLHQIPWSTKAAAVQAGVMTGGFLLFP